jgi:hypothetical protein
MKTYIFVCKTYAEFLLQKSTYEVQFYLHANSVKAVNKICAQKENKYCKVCQIGLNKKVPLIFHSECK